MSHNPEYDERGVYQGPQDHRADMSREWSHREEIREAKEEAKKEALQEVRDEQQDTDINELKSAQKIQDRWINHLIDENKELKKRYKLLVKRHKELEAYVESVEWEEDLEWTKAVDELREMLEEATWAYKNLWKRLKKSKWWGKVKWGTISGVGAGILATVVMWLKNLMGL